MFLQPTLISLKTFPNQFFNQTWFYMKSLDDIPELLLDYFRLHNSEWLSYWDAFLGGSNSGMKRFFKLKEHSNVFFFQGPCNSWKIHFILESIFRLTCIYIFIISQLTFKKSFKLYRNLTITKPEANKIHSPLPSNVPSSTVQKKKNQKLKIWNFQ